jgi:hypothetical protein
MINNNANKSYENKNDHKFIDIDLIVNSPILKGKTNSKPFEKDNLNDSKKMKS